MNVIVSAQELALAAEFRVKVLDLFTNPWETEPDLVKFRDPVTGLKCVMVRHPSFGNWCGYVQVPPGELRQVLKNRQKAQHRGWKNKLEHGYGYDHPVARNIEVHGGLTFSGRYHRGTAMTRGFWLGFDCAHAGDLMPGLDKHLRKLGHLYADELDQYEVYRDQEYVTQNVLELAKQIKTLLNRVRK